MMKSSMLQRTHSESPSSAASPPPKIWRIGSALRKMQSKTNAKDHKAHVSSADNDFQESALHLQPTHTSSSSFPADNTDSHHRQLVSLVQRMRAAPAGPNHVDAAYKEFTKIKDRAIPLCYAILQEEIKPLRQGPMSFSSELPVRRESSLEVPQSPLGTTDQRSSFSGRSFSEMTTHGTSRSVMSVPSEVWLGTIRDWKNCLELLAETFRTSLAETYKSYERDATPEMLDHLFNNKKFRKEAVHRMRNASVTRVLSADPQYFPRYEIRFRNYERVKEDLREIKNLLQAGESGISPDRQVGEYLIAPKGDTILEFANLNPEANGDEPVLRFRVSSHLLAETSPIFARMFGGHAACHDDDDIASQLPPPSAKYMCRDGSEAKLFKMPQYEVNRLESLEILLHAAHMHHDKLPKEVAFEQFVAIAECSMRYKCTSPLEPVVEHRWLPQWMHRGADEMPDGLLVISYAFGLRDLFTRMSKSAMLDLLDEPDLHSKPWPRRIRDKMWAVRCAKMEQVYACCTTVIQEYIQPPSPSLERQASTELTQPPESGTHHSSNVATPQSAASLSSKPRCPKGSHWCDASNLGWMMLVFNEMGCLAQMLRPAATSHLGPEGPHGSRSLAQLFDILRRVPNPTAPIHRGGVCDPCPAFKSALNDVYSSVSGLTLHDVSGKSHGWALSKHEINKPQMLAMSGLKRMAAKDPNHSVATEFPETVRLNVLSKIDNLDDLHSAAMVNWAYYETYKTHELYLMRNILRHDRMRAGSRRHILPIHAGMAEEKFLTAESDRLRTREARLAADAMTLRSEVGDEDYDSDDLASVDETPAPSISDWNDSPPRRSSGPNYNASRGPAARRPLPTSRRADVAPDDMDYSPSTPRQGSIPRRLDDTTLRKPSVSYTEFADETPMTDEEARRILWPDEEVERAAPVQAPVFHGVEVVSEKFRMGDPFFKDALEDKTLVLSGQKQLRSEHQQRMDILRRQGRVGVVAPGAGGQEGTSRDL